MDAEAEVVDARRAMQATERKRAHDAEAAADIAAALEAETAARATLEAEVVDARRAMIASGERAGPYTSPPLLSSN